MIGETMLEITAKADPPGPDRLGPEESDRLARVAAVWSLARQVFEAPETARRFLAGADAVINILGRAAYGAAV
jgi:uncharacterized protein (DUF2384 family)